MLEERRIFAVEGLQCVGSSTELMGQVWVQRRGRDGRLDAEGEAEVIGQAAEPLAQGLLGGDALFQLRQRVARDGLHGCFQLTGERMQRVEILRGREVAVSTACRCHLWHFL